MQFDITKVEADEINRFSWDLRDALRDRFSGSRSTEMYAFAYAIYKLQEIKMYTACPDIQDLLKLITDDKVRLFVEHSITSHWSVVMSLFGKYASQTIMAFIMSQDINERGIETTPMSIIDLSLRLLSINANDTVIDYGSGLGSFLFRAVQNESGAEYTGVELQTNLVAIARIRAELAGFDIKLEQYDMFRYSANNKKYTKIFSNYPFGMRALDMRENVNQLMKNQIDLPELQKVKSSDWVYNSLLISNLAKSGKAIGIMTAGSTWNSMDKPIRELFVRKGYIEAVISLPEKLFDFPSFQTVLVVLSHGNKSIRLVDAREIYQKGRRQNFLTQENVDLVADAVVNDTSISRTVSFDELIKADYIINPMRYIEIPNEYENGAEFGTVIKNITRGAPLTASQLDEMASAEITDYQYLMLSNIRDGIIDTELPYIKEIDKRYKKYCIKNGNLLLSKNGSPFKIAVATCVEGKSVLANGNLYIIELDETRVRPYYLKAFFESEQGAVALNSIAVGAAIPNIAVEQLKKLIIPLPDIELQREIEERYIAKFNEVLMLQSKLTNAFNALKNVFVEDANQI